MLYLFVNCVIAYLVLASVYAVPILLHPLSDQYIDPSKQELREFPISSSFFHSNGSFLELSITTEPKELPQWFNLTYLPPVFVKKIGNGGFAVEAVAGNSTLYVGNTLVGLVVVDFENIQSPKTIGILEVERGIYRVFLKNNYLYVVGNSWSFLIIDVTVPSNPVLISDPGIQAGDVCVSDDLQAYICDGKSLLIYDVSDVTDLVLKGSYIVQNCMLRKVYYHNHIAFISVESGSCRHNCFDGVQVLDVSNPSSILKIWEKHAVGWYFGGLVKGKSIGYMFTASALEIYNMTDLHNPVLLGDYFCDIIRDLLVSEDLSTVYIAKEDLGVVILSMTLDRNGSITFALVSSLETSHATSLSFYGDNDEILIVTDEGGGVRFVSISDRSNPFIISTHDEYSDFYMSVVVNEDYIYVSDHSGGIKIFENTDDPCMDTNLLSSYDTLLAGHLVVQEREPNIVYVLDAESEILFIDVSKMSFPQLTGKWLSTSKINHFIVENDFMYVCQDPPNWFQIVDISDKQNPVLVNETNGPLDQDFNCGEISVDVEQQIAVAMNPWFRGSVAWGGNDIFFLDISSNRIDVVAKMKCTNSEESYFEAACRQAVIEGDTVYVSTYQIFGYNQGIVSIDISDLRNPVVLSETNYLLGFEDAYTENIFVKHSQVYVYGSDYLFGENADLKFVYVFDFTNKSFPVLLNKIPVNSEMHDFSIRNNHIYLAGNGLEIYEMGDVMISYDPEKIPSEECLNSNVRVTVTAMDEDEKSAGGQFTIVVDDLCPYYKECNYTGYYCGCPDDYFGEFCNRWKCYDHDYDDVKNVCGGHGTCGGPDECSCFSPTYFERDCSDWTCFGIPQNSRSGVCGGHGMCYSADVCLCDHGYSPYPHVYGGPCTTWWCGEHMMNEKGVCSNQGLCVEPQNCTCFVGYTGRLCENKKKSNDENQRSELADTPKSSFSGTSIALVAVSGSFAVFVCCFMGTIFCLLLLLFCCCLIVGLFTFFYSVLSGICGFTLFRKTGKGGGRIVNLDMLEEFTAFQDEESEFVKLEDQKREKSSSLGLKKKDFDTGLKKTLLENFDE